MTSCITVSTNKYYTFFLLNTHPDGGQHWSPLWTLTPLGGGYVNLGKNQESAFSPKILCLSLDGLRELLGRWDEYLFENKNPGSRPLIQ